VARQEKKVSKKNEEDGEKKTKNETKVCYGSSDNAYVFVATIKEKKRKQQQQQTEKKEVAFAEVQYNNNNNSKKKRECNAYENCWIDILTNKKRQFFFLHIRIDPFTRLSNITHTCEKRKNR